MQNLAWWPTIAAVMIATITDLRSRRIPNWLIVPFLAIGPVFSMWVAGWGGLWQSALGMLMAAACMGLLYFLGAMGMGDVKLCVAIGGWIWPHQLAFALAFMGLAGGLIALISALWRGVLIQSLDGAAELIFGIRNRGLGQHPTLRLANPAARSIPYAPAIAIGAIFSFFAIR